jgi:hypothetical protein
MSILPSQSSQRPPAVRGIVPIGRPLAAAGNAISSTFSSRYQSAGGSSSVVPGSMQGPRPALVQPLPRARQVARCYLPPDEDQERETRWVRVVSYHRALADVPKMWLPRLAVMWRLACHTQTYFRTDSPLRVSDEDWFFTRMSLPKRDADVAHVQNEINRQGADSGSMPPTPDVVKALRGLADADENPESFDNLFLATTIAYYSREGWLHPSYQMMLDVLETKWNPFRKTEASDRSDARRLTVDRMRRLLQRPDNDSASRRPADAWLYAAFLADEEGDVSGTALADIGAVWQFVSPSTCACVMCALHVPLTPRGDELGIEALLKSLQRTGHALMRPECPADMDEREWIMDEVIAARFDFRAFVCLGTRCYDYRCNPKKPYSASNPVPRPYFVYVPPGDQPAPERAAPAPAPAPLAPPPQVLARDPRPSQSQDAPAPPHMRLSQSPPHQRSPSPILAHDSDAEDFEIIDRRAASDSPPFSPSAASDEEMNVAEMTEEEQRDFEDDVADFLNTSPRTLAARTGGSDDSEFAKTQRISQIQRMKKSVSEVMEEDFLDFSPRESAGTQKKKSKKARRQPRPRNAFIDDEATRDSGESDDDEDDDEMDSDDREFVVPDDEVEYQEDDEEDDENNLTSVDASDLGCLMPDDKVSEDEDGDDSVKGLPRNFFKTNIPKPSCEEVASLTKELIHVSMEDNINRTKEQKQAILQARKGKELQKAAVQADKELRRIRTAGALRQASIRRDDDEEIAAIASLVGVNVSRARSAAKKKRSRVIDDDDDEENDEKDEVAESGAKDDEGVDD